MNQELKVELQHRTKQALKPVSIEEFTCAFAELGYKIDRSLDCRFHTFHLSGDRKGLKYPCITTRVKEADTGLSAFHVDARRDSNFQAMQLLRNKVFCVTQDAILQA